jgi:CheY-like chemotaxis protein
MTAYTALVVDDNEFNRDILRVSLERSGFEVLEAPGGGEALKILDDKVFDALILDLQMPIINGRDVLQAITGQERHQHSKRVIVTANAHMTEEELEGACDMVLLKPVNVREFGLLILRLVKGDEA